MSKKKITKRTKVKSGAEWCDTAAQAEQFGCGTIILLGFPALLQVSRSLRPFVKYVNYNHIMPTRYQEPWMPWLCINASTANLRSQSLNEVPAEMSPATICSDQQMESLDGRKEARKMAKSLLIARCFKVVEGIVAVFLAILIMLKGCLCFLHQLPEASFRRSFRHRLQTRLADLPRTGAGRFP